MNQQEQEAQNIGNIWLKEGLKYLDENRNKKKNIQAASKLAKEYIKLRRKEDPYSPIDISIDSNGANITDEGLERDYGNINYLEKTGGGSFNNQTLITDFADQSENWFQNTIKQPDAADLAKRAVQSYMDNNNENVLSPGKPTKPIPKGKDQTPTKEVTGKEAAQRYYDQLKYMTPEEQAKYFTAENIARGNTTSIQTSGTAPTAEYKAPILMEETSYSNPGFKGNIPFSMKYLVNKAMQERISNLARGDESENFYTGMLPARAEEEKAYAATVPSLARKYSKLDEMHKKFGAEKSNIQTTVRDDFKLSNPSSRPTSKGTTKGTKGSYYTITVPGVGLTTVNTENGDGKNHTPVPMSKDALNPNDAMKQLDYLVKKSNGYLKEIPSGKAKEHGFDKAFVAPNGSVVGTSGKTVKHILVNENDATLLGIQVNKKQVAAKQQPKK